MVDKFESEWLVSGQKSPKGSARCEGGPADPRPECTDTLLAGRVAPTGRGRTVRRRMRQDGCLSVLRRSVPAVVKVKGSVRMGVELQVQAKALGDPTRHRIFRYIADAAAPVGVAELTDHVGLNHNAIRQHLAQLVGAELVVETVAATGSRGRPPLRYEVHPGADSRWGVAGPYERLSIWLTEVVRTRDSPFEVGRRVGRRRRLAVSAAADPAEAMFEQLTVYGFAPTVTRAGDRLEYVATVCPYEATALADPDTVCEMHRGIAIGVAESVGGIVVDELAPNDPRRANCRILCHLEPASE